MTEARPSPHPTSSRVTRTPTIPCATPFQAASPSTRPRGPSTRCGCPATTSSRTSRRGEALDAAVPDQQDGWVVLLPMALGGFEGDRRRRVLQLVHAPAQQPDQRLVRRVLADPRGGGEVLERSPCRVHVHACHDGPD